MVVFRESAHRQAIMKFLQTRSDHPNAVTIYDGLKRKIAKLSLGTVYRNLDILTKQGRVRVIKVGQQEARYDGCVVQHGHFYCQACGKLEDINLKKGCCQMAAQLYKQGYSINELSLDIRGLCNHCSKDVKRN